MNFQKNAVIEDDETLIFDTHCHLSDEIYVEEEIPRIISESKDVGVRSIINVGYDKKSNEKVVEQLTLFPDLFVALGIHPNSNLDLNDDNLNWIEKKLKEEKRIVAIGEIGLDYYRSSTNIEKQKIWFKKQLILAKSNNLPVLLHIRDAFDDAYLILVELGIKKGIMHCFTGDWITAEKFINLGFYISFAGNITYGNRGFDKKWEEVISKIPIEKVVVETDSPYLSPVPFRGKINYPKNIINTIKIISRIKDIEFSEVCRLTYKNSLKLLHLKNE